MIITVKTTGKQARVFYRAGLKFTEQPRELEVVSDVEDAATQITEAQYKQIKTESLLQVSVKKADKKLDGAKPDELDDLLDSMNQKQLREEADKRKLEYSNNDSKDKLREMIREHDKKAAKTEAPKGNVGKGAGE